MALSLWRAADHCYRISLLSALWVTGFSYETIDFHQYGSYIDRHIKHYREFQFISFLVVNQICASLSTTARIMLFIYLTTMNLVNINTNPQQLFVYALKPRSYISMRDICIYAETNIVMDMYALRFVGFACRLCWILISIFISVTY